MHNYKELNVWKKSVELATETYKIARSFPSEEKFGLVSQVQRSAVSIASNIAEGAGRDSHAQFNHFLSIAYASCYELTTQLTIGKNLGYLNEESLNVIEERINEIQKM